MNDIQSQKPQNNQEELHEAAHILVHEFMIHPINGFEFKNKSKATQYQDSLWVSEVISNKYYEAIGDLVIERSFTSFFSSRLSEILEDVLLFKIPTNKENEEKSRVRNKATIKLVEVFAENYAEATGCSIISKYSNGKSDLREWYHEQILSLEDKVRNLKVSHAIRSAISHFGGSNDTTKIFNLYGVKGVLFEEKHEDIKLIEDVMDCFRHHTEYKSFISKNKFIQKSKSELLKNEAFMNSQIDLEKVQKMEGYYSIISNIELDRIDEYEEALFLISSIYKILRESDNYSFNVTIHKASSKGKRFEGMRLFWEGFHHVAIEILIFAKNLKGTANNYNSTSEGIYKFLQNSKVVKELGIELEGNYKTNLKRLKSLTLKNAKNTPLNMTNLTTSVIYQRLEELEREVGNKSPEIDEFLIRLKQSLFEILPQATLT
jgi:hypothetical protein